jgi:hypothetical protein
MQLPLLRCALHACIHILEVYSDVQKSLPVKLARLLPYITIGCCFDSHPRIDSVLQRPGFRYGLLENAIHAAEAGVAWGISGR